MLFCIFRGRLEKTHGVRLWRVALVLFLVIRDFLFCSSSALTFKDKRSDGTSRRTAQSQGRGSKRRKRCNDFRGFRGHDFRGHFTGPDCFLVSLFAQIDQWHFFGDLSWFFLLIFHGSFFCSFMVLFVDLSWFFSLILSGSSSGGRYAIIFVVFVAMIFVAISPAQIASLCHFSL